MPDRRANPRRSFVSRVQVDVLGEAEAVSSQRGLLEDKSPAGAGISVSKAIAVGTRVRVRLKDGEFVGIVHHCSRGGMGYALGIRYEGDETASNLT